MSDLPYYCHICDRVVYIEDRVQCPQCRESFLELHTEDLDDEEERISIPATNCMGGFLGLSFFGCTRQRAMRPERKRTITSDRRNYAIGPEIDDIISRLRDERGIDENPATEEQRSRLILSEIAGTDEVCTICFCPFEGSQQGYKYPCSHGFHVECSDAWLKLQSDCPMCRKSL
ncbi:hypothetical protein NEPAR06_1523 [Nematocida parisii]|uniref:RING-type domain-containing protein n=1 Tax=Nematocida parisii (strain ERTm3) TaxID=935791 RepID=I3EHB4_NEMP3|nr:uncharacterized protein NEPG_00387 [Nematocida parisii ERTm1]EIJ88611.1 hypothetical protein NEQG_01301 [Nematocida parisii ERTm3]KAI5126654.1 hypothetical protein NEPAR03_0575 [Nematocida parisii]EIJ94862.1 hypothetical protein NEPG_00387 [Nematocida parisii ERTm1]KAI5130247.1 hypothetical protein NEPAR08_1931 [Nematocida parisii]KAI5143449.1 hypothetical protein NEPAR04_1840 [Nematocida parisii]|eukprot:XP_013058218.1 hypothetical protein NEPG_00387 [Nematocida parisii ERTm1]